MLSDGSEAAGCVSTDEKADLQQEKQFSLPPALWSVCIGAVVTARSTRSRSRCHGSASSPCPLTRGHRVPSPALSTTGADLLWEVSPSKTSAFEHPWWPCCWARWAYEYYGRANMFCSGRASSCGSLGSARGSCCSPLERCRAFPPVGELLLGPVLLLFLPKANRDKEGTTRKRLGLIESTRDLCSVNKRSLCKTVEGRGRELLRAWLGNVSDQRFSPCPGENTPFPSKGH